MRKLLVIIGLIVLVVVADYYRDIRTVSEVELEPQPTVFVADVEEDQDDYVHYHAGFLVYEEGNMVDFSALKYMHLESCGDEHGDDDPEHEQIEKAHLHDGVGDVVHVHREGGTWGDLFSNISYDIDWDKVIAYGEGEMLENIQDREIIPNESVIIIVGDSEGVDLDNYVEQDRIDEVEAISEDCGVE